MQENYGFTCDCALCIAGKAASSIPPLPSDPEQVSELEGGLCAFVAANVLQLDPLGPPAVNKGADAYSKLPPELLPLLGQGYLPTLSEAFSKASHEGSYDRALSTGRVLLALYVVLYPENYPQIGMNTIPLPSRS